MIEIIATRVEDLPAILHGGAKRIELVSALAEGGLTPSHATLAYFSKHSTIPVRAMVRPHSASFHYSDADIQLMKEEITYIRSLHIDGVVFGCLDAKNDIHIEHLEELLSVCGDLNVTFHRAIDDTNNCVESVQTLLNYPQIKTILTSGGPGTCMDNIPTLREMVRIADGKVQILAGSGLNEQNVAHIYEQTGAKAFHFGTAARTDLSIHQLANVDKVRSLVNNVLTLVK